MQPKALCLFERVVNRLSRGVNVAAASVLALMMLLTATDVCLRYIFNRPISGSMELTKYMMVIVVSLGLAYCALLRGHVRVDMLVSRLPQRAREILDSVGHLLSLGLFSLIGWQCVMQAKEIGLSGLTSEVLFIPVFPFVIVLAIGSWLLCLVFLVHLLGSALQAVRK